MSGFQYVIAASLAILACLTNAQTQTRTQAQAHGSSLAESALGSGALSPAATVNAGTQQGSANVWGGAYTGAADPALTGKSTSGSLLTVGNQARQKAVAEHQGYNNSRDGQSSQATYFLDRNPTHKPTLSPNDPLFSTSNLNSHTAFLSSSSRVCRQETTPGRTATEEYKCIQSYDPYVITCSNTTQVAPAGTELACVNTSFLCIAGAGSCCTTTLTCNGTNATATIQYRDCCGYNYQITIDSANKLRDGVVINPAGANVRCDAGGNCQMNFANYLCATPWKRRSYTTALTHLPLDLNGSSQRHQRAIVDLLRDWPHHEGFAQPSLMSLCRCHGCAGAANPSWDVVLQ